MTLPLLDCVIRVPGYTKEDYNGEPTSIVSIAILPWTELFMRPLHELKHFNFLNCHYACRTSFST